jgi:Sec-independent protein translocase protein TatA
MIGISEIFLILIVVIILFKPDDYQTTIRKIRSFQEQMKKYFENLKNHIYDDDIKKIETDFENLQNEFININGKNYIYGEDKKLHEVYDLKNLTDLKQ